MISRVNNSCVILNITNRCNLRCGFCPRAEDQRADRENDPQAEREPSAHDIILAIGNPEQYDEVIFSGLGEPTLRLYVTLEAALAFRRLGLRTRLVTNGLANHFYGRDVTADLENIIDAVSISLNAQDEMTYNSHCASDRPGAYAAVLDFADRVRYFVPDVTLTAVAGLPGVDIPACQQIAHNLGVGFEVHRPGLFV